MTLAPYRGVLAVPAVRRLLAFGVLARVPQTAAGVVLTLHVVLALGRGYGAAGLVATAGTVGGALGAPYRGRAVDRHGLRRALVPSIIAEALVWGSAPFLPYPALLGAAFVGGLLALPVFTVLRQSLSVLVPLERRRTAFALDSMGVELSFMAGPAAGVVLATQGSTALALLCVGAATVLAGCALFAIDPPTVSAQDGGPAKPVAEVRRRPSWFSPRLASVFAASAAATLVLSATDVSVVALVREADAVGLTGPLFVVWGAASMVGGLVYGGARRSVSPFVLLLGLAVFTAPAGLASTPALLALAVFTAPAGLASTPALLALAMVPAGLLCAPVISATAEAVSRLVPERARGEAMGWHGSSLTVGVAVGAPAAGAWIDAAGPGAGFLFAGLAGAGLAAAGLLLERRAGDTRPGAPAVTAEPSAARIGP